MGTIAGVLEILPTELLILHLDAARGGSVEEREAMTLAGFLYGTYHNGEAFVGQIPWRHDGNLGIRIFIAQSRIEFVEVYEEGIQRILALGHKVRIVMTRHHKHVVGIIDHIRITHIERFAEIAVRAVEGDGTTIATIVVISHPVLGSHLVVPGILK